MLNKEKSHFMGKRSFGILAIFILICNLVFAQENLFEKMSTNFIASKPVSEKIERFKSRNAIKQWEQILLKPNIILSKNLKGIFNIFDKNLEFEITEDYGKDVNGVQGYKAELKDGGYAIISSSNEGIGASVWYKDSFYSIEAVEDGIYFVSEVDLNEIAKHENPNDYGSIKKLNKTTQNTSVTSVLSAATIKVFVAYTPAVAQNYNVSTLISECRNVTNNAYSNSLVSSRIELAGSAQLTYTESGNSITDVNRFMTNNDGYMDEIHSLRNQYEADVCVLLVNTLDNNGYAASIGAEFADAFYVVKASAAVSNYSFPHELGHLFGCRHDSDTGTTPYAFAHGYNWYGKLPYSSNPRFYRTIMSVELESKYMRVQYFSNPNVYDQLNNRMGTTNYNYCASAIDDYASTIASFEGAKPVISNFYQNPTPLINGGTGYVYAQLSSGDGEITYSWSESHYPAMTVTLTHLGSSCQVHYYIPYNTNYDIFITCTASNAFGSDTKTYRLISQYSSYSSFASLAFETNGELIDENPILVSSVDNPGVDVTDYYLINKEIILENNTIKFLIRETDQTKGYTNLDQVELWEVKANKNEFIAVTDEGEVISYKKLEKPNQIILNDSLDITDVLADTDEFKLPVKKGDRIKISHSGNISVNNEELYSVIYARLNDEEKLSDANNNSSDLNKYYFRPQPSTASKKLKVVPAGGVEIEFSDNLVIDYFALVKNEKTVKVEKLKLLEAVHKTRGDVSKLLTGIDSGYNEIYPGEKVSFAFESKNNSDEKVAYIIKTVGRYEEAGLGKSVKNNDTGINEIASLPTEIKLLGNYPNPFNPTTIINYQLPENSFVTIKVFDLLGKEVATLVNENKPAGYYKINFDASKLTSGIYIYTINAGKFIQSKKMLLMK